VFSTAKERDNPELRASWKPILDKHRVDLVLQGHDHTYGRTGLETPLAVPETVGNVATGTNQVDQKTGTVYVVSVSGPKMYDLNPKPFMKRTAENTQLYQIIHVDGGTLRYEARTAVGDVYDAFTLRKRPGSINEMVESSEVSRLPSRARR
ncbi:MAG: metallophosphoesterase, partial [Pirellulaceae bacterium]